MVVVRIVVLRVEDDVWCDMCGVPCAVTIVYLLEERDRPPDGVRVLTCCDNCQNS